MLESLLTVTVMIPIDKLDELYLFCSDLLRSHELAATIPSEHGWHKTDELTNGHAIWLHWSISPKAREFMDFLIDHPGEKFSADDLVRSLNSFNSNNELTGALSSISLRANSLSKDVPYSYENGHYWLEPEMAELFRMARLEGQHRRGRAWLSNPDAIVRSGSE